jgi:hypothetical protein
MSIKRTNSKTGRRGTDSAAPERSSSSAPRKKEITWQEAVADKPNAAFVDYAAKELFTVGTLLNHPTFGKGIVLSAEGQKMEVLFAESKKLLIMGRDIVRSSSDDS